MIKLLYACDLHGSELCFKKFLSASSIYHADALILGGDLAGKGIVPIIQQRNSTYSSNFLGKTHRAKTEKEIQTLEERIRQTGFYAHRMTEEEAEAANDDPLKQDELFHDCIVAGILRWVDLAERRLPDTAQFFWIPGNDDPDYITAPMTSSNRLIMCDDQVVVIRDLFEMVSLGYSNRTPFNSPRELDEPDMREKLRALTEKLSYPGKSIFNLHCPPVSSGLDRVPKLTDDLRVDMSYGDQSMTDAGSVAVREYIELLQPMLALHGHCHESRGKAMLGGTLCLNPGSDYATGVLRAVIVDIDEQGFSIKNHQFISG